MRVLITGAQGLLGPYVFHAFRDAKHQVSVISRFNGDLINRAFVKGILDNIAPEVVVHCAALTDIDECEREPIKALAANRDAVHHLVEQLSPKAKFVYISTDMVYPDIRGPHREPETGPVNMYGRSKLAGEKAAAVNPRHLILRTNFFGPRLEPTPVSRKSFSDWVLESLTDGSTPIFYSDVWFSPLHMKTLSAVILELVERDVVGIYNLGATSAMSKAIFARALAEHRGLLTNYDAKCVGPAHWRIRRPHDTSIDCERLLAMGVKLPTLEEEIKKL